MPGDSSRAKPIMELVILLLEFENHRLMAMAYIYDTDMHNGEAETQNASN